MDYRSSFGTAIGLMQESARFMSLFLPGHELQEAQNKLEAFRLFAFADQELNFPANGLAPLGSLVRRALALSNYRRIWALEGVAHQYMSDPAQDSVRGLLLDPELPDCAMVSMHAGMGTAFAGRVLSRLESRPSKPALREALERFFEFCRVNSRPGWYENAIEPMGLAVRTLHPRLLDPVSDVVAEIDINARRLFWHGVGRSLYFVPSNFVTVGGAHERALRAAVAEAPGLEDRQNAVAGLVWAVTLVNIRQPAVLKSLLRAAENIRVPDAVRNGIVSALMVWKHMVPEDVEFLPPYLRSAPGPVREARLWSDLVATPARRAFEEMFPALVSQGRIASLFQYREI